MKFLVLLIVLALTVAMVPSAAFAASSADVAVHVRNQTGGLVQLSMSLPSGSPVFRTLEEGVTSFIISDGLYTYYASTPCGNMSGQWNINVAKTLYLTCKTGSPATTFTKFANRFKECDEGVYSVAVAEDYVQFNSWLIWGDSTMESILHDYNVVIHTPQQTADFWNIVATDGGRVTYYAGCYDGVATYYLP
jgi:hypothetical protein